MGRRPNALVSEYFTRGAKCTDTSNRYSHTCKRCGEHFPKGRVDSLMSHLLRRCSHTSQVERNFIYRAIQQQNPTPPIREIAKVPRSPIPAVEGGETQLTAEALSPVSLQAQHQSALDTLAEVSRQQLDSSPHDQPSQDVNVDVDVDVEQTSPVVGQEDAEEQFYAQLREAVNSTPDTHVTGSEVHSSAKPPIHTPAPLVETASAANEQLEQTSGHENLDPALECHDTHSQQNQDLYRPSHNDYPMQQDGGMDEARPEFTHSSPIIDNDTPMSDLTHVQPLSNNHEPMSWIPTSGPIEMYPSSHNLQNVMAVSKKPIKFPPKDDLIDTHTFPTNPSGVTTATNQPISNFAHLRNANKVRSKFSDNRRKEVQEVRKRGACIRCRMLKKPCSEGTPCNTCKTVGSARLWKWQCLRTRLADEFTLCSVGIFASRAQAVLTEAYQGLEKTSTDAVIEVCLLPTSGVFVPLPLRKYNQNNLAKQRIAMNAYGGEDPDLRLRANLEAHIDSPPIYLLDEVDGGVTARLEEHITQLIDGFIGQESSLFLRSTLQRARSMIQEEQEEEETNGGAEQPATTTPKNPLRTTSHTFPTHRLLHHVLDLWASTTIITAQQSDPAKKNNNISMRFPTSQNITASSTSHQPENLPLLHSQLLAKLETRCANLSKTIISELERRLLQRQQVSRFGTLIAAVVLVNCVERMTGWVCQHAGNEGGIVEDEVGNTGEGDGDDHLGNGDRGSEGRMSWRQGSHFVSLLTTLLHMRGLIPKTMTDGDGRLVVVAKKGRKLELEGSSSSSMTTTTTTTMTEKKGKKQELEGLEIAAAEWLDPLGLDFQEMRRLKMMIAGGEKGEEGVLRTREGKGEEEGEKEGSQTRASEWDMRFIAGILVAG